MKKNCERCGNEFKPKHPSRKYCSQKCKQYAYFERNGMSFGQTKNQSGNSIKPETIVEDVTAVENITAVVSVNQTPAIKEIPKPEQVKDEKAVENITAVVSVNQAPVIQELTKMKPVNDVKTAENNAVLPANQSPAIKEIPKPESILPQENKNDMPKLIIEKEKPVAVNNVIDVSKLSLEQFTVLLRTMNQKKPEKENFNTGNSRILDQDNTLLPEIQKGKQEIKPKTFLQKLKDRTSISFGENQFIAENYPNWNYSDWSNIKWVNERLKSYFKKLMHYSKKWIDVKDVEYLLENIKEMIESFSFRHLPEDYPFTKFVIDISEKLERAVDQLKEDETEKTILKISETDYIEMKSIVFEIGNTVPDFEPEKKIRINRYERRYKNLFSGS